MNSNYSTKLREIHKTVCLSSLFNLTHANLDWGIRMVRGIQLQTLPRRTKLSLDLHAPTTTPIPKGKTLNPRN